MARSRAGALAVYAGARTVTASTTVAHGRSSDGRHPNASGRMISDRVLVGERGQPGQDPGRGDPG